MLYHHVTGNSLAEGLENALKVLHSDGIVYEGENQDREDKVKEISLVLNILNPLSEPMISKCMPSGLKGLMEYTEEFLRGSRDFEPYWEYTYHKLYAQYYDKFIDELRRNNTTRRACMNLGGAINFENPHPPCLQLIDANIREGKLHLSAFFRSNDAVKASAMNMFVLVMLQKQIADELGLEVGIYTHIAESYHAYSEDWETLETYVGLYGDKPIEKRVYSYADFLKTHDKYIAEYYKSVEERKIDVANKKHE